MAIKWSNIVCFGLVLLAAILAIRNQIQIAGAIHSIGSIGPGHTAEDQTIGLATLGVCLVALVAIVRILCAHAEQKNDSTHSSNAHHRRGGGHS